MRAERGSPDPDAPENARRRLGPLLSPAAEPAAAEKHAEGDDDDSSDGATNDVENVLAFKGVLTLRARTNTAAK